MFNKVTWHLEFSTIYFSLAEILPNSVPVLLSLVVLAESGRVLRILQDSGQSCMNLGGTGKYFCQMLLCLVPRGMLIYWKLFVVGGNNHNWCQWSPRETPYQRRGGTPLTLLPLPLLASLASLMSVQGEGGLLSEYLLGVEPTVRRVLFIMGTGRREPGSEEGGMRPGCQDPWHLSAVKVLQVDISGVAEGRDDRYIYLRWRQLKKQSDSWRSWHLIWAGNNNIFTVPTENIMEKDTGNCLRRTSMTGMISLTIWQPKGVSIG